MVPSEDRNLLQKTVAHSCGCPRKRPQTLPLKVYRVAMHEHMTKSQELIHRACQVLVEQLWQPRLMQRAEHVQELPPFRELSAEEDRQVVAEVAASGARLLFVGLGCPKQERWMAAHARTLAAVQIGVGAAFDFACGNKPRPPRFVQTAGLEWVFRLACEPRRLWRRYLYHNPRFLALLSSQLVRSR